MCRTFCCLFNKGNKKGEKFETEYNDIVDRGWNVVSKPVYARIQIKSDARECLEIRFPSRGMGLGLECVHEKERAILYGKFHQHFWEPDVKIIRILVEISKIWTNVCLKVRKIINVVFLNSKQGNYYKQNYYKYGKFTNRLFRKTTKSGTIGTKGNVSLYRCIDRI